MTPGQREVMLALNLRQMRAADQLSLSETGTMTEEVAAVCGLGNRSTAVLLASCRRRGWVRSINAHEWTGWWLLSKGVRALEGAAIRDFAPSDKGAR